MPKPSKVRNKIIEDSGPFEKGLGLDNLFSYNNYSLHPDNTCGQAVLASILDYTDKVPYPLERTGRSPLDGKLHYQPEELLSCIVRDHGPNWPMRGSGVTVRKTLTNALKAYGVRYEEIRKPPLTPRNVPHERFIRFLAAKKGPAIVLLDAHKLGWGPRFSFHWAIAIGYNDEYVRVASWDKTYRIPWSLFLKAWRCWFLSYPYNYFQIQIPAPLNS